MYDTVISLVTETISHDDVGNEIYTSTTTDVFAIPRSVYASEFYQAAQIGLHPSITFTLTNREDYEGQKKLIWEGKNYSIIRADWTAQRDTLNLICEERIGNGS